MIGSLAQGAILMGVIYWYSKSMFSMINNYYREEFNRNVMHSTTEGTDNSIEKTEKTKRTIEETEINTKIPTTPTMEGLPDILKENSFAHNDDKIVTRVRRDSLNCKLTLDIRQLDCEEKILSSNENEKSNYEITKNLDEKYVYTCSDSVNCNQDNKLPGMLENSCTQSYKKDEKLLNLKQFNNDHQCLNLPSISSTVTEQENKKIEKIKNKLYNEYDVEFIDNNNNPNDDIVTVDYKMESSNPSTSAKLNYVSNRNQYVPITDTNNYSKEIQYDGESINVKCDRKLPINQLHDKNKCNNNLNIGSCENNINSSKPPHGKYYNKNRDDVTGNCCNSNKISKKITTNNINASSSQKNSISSLNLRSINNNKDNLKENSKSYTDINTFQSNRDNNEMKFCRRKSVSEYIAFWSNIQP